jgi:hypothetical protein
MGSNQRDGAGFTRFESMIFSLPVSFIYFVLVKKGNQLDRKEQACMGYCQDLYLETRAQVQAALQDRQSQM